MSPSRTRAMAAAFPEEEEDDLNLEHRIEERIQGLMQQQKDEAQSA